MISSNDRIIEEKLIENEILRLTELMKANRNSNPAFIRLQVCMLWRRGYQQTIISQITGLTPVTVNKYIRDYKVDPSLKSQKHLPAGRPSYLNKKQRKELFSLLEKSRDDYPRCRWNVHSVIQFIQEKYGITYTYTGLTKLLDKNDFKFITNHTSYYY